MSNESSFDDKYDASNIKPFSPHGFQKKGKNFQKTQKYMKYNIIAYYIGFFSQQRGENSFSLSALSLPSKELSFDTQQACISIILKMVKIALGDL